MKELVDIIRNAWGIDTSSAPGRWTNTNPATGQCAVTALVVQDELGGDLLRSTVNGESHYFNRTADGSLIDLTLGQFDGWAWYDTPPVERERGYVLGFPDTARRYETLRRMVDACAEGTR